MRLARQQRGCIGSIKALRSIKENHLFRLSLGVHVSDNFQRTSRLNQRHFHVQAAEVDAENGACVNRLSQ
jgi:hypothetical protein